MPRRNENAASPVVRYGTLLELAIKGESVKLKEVAERLNITERTLHSDVTKLEKALEKAEPGRGLLTVNMAKLPYCDTQRLRHVEEKEDIARYIAEKLFKAARVVASTPGSTNEMTVQWMVNKRKAHTIITNSLGVAQQVEHKDVTIKLTGGEFYPPVMAMVGREAADRFRDEPADVGLVGVSGLTAPDGQLYAAHPREILPLQEMLRTAGTLVLLVDIHKLGTGDSKTDTDDTEPWAFAHIPKLLEEADGPKQVFLVTNYLEDWKEEVGERYPAIDEVLKLLRNYEVQSSNQKVGTEEESDSASSTNKQPPGSSSKPWKPFKVIEVSRQWWKVDQGENNFE